MIYDGLDTFLAQHCSLHVLLQIAVHEVEDQLQLILSGYDFPKANNVRMGESLEEGDLSDRSGGESLVLMVQSDFLDCDDVVCEFVPCLVDHSVGAFSNLAYTLVALHLVAA